MKDRIVLEAMQFYGFHGVNPEERSMGQLFLVNLAVEMDLAKPGGSDQLEDTVSYTHLYRTVQSVMEGEPRQLLEAVAQAVADKVLSSYPVDGVEVSVKKLRPPVRGAVTGHPSVEIYRTQGDRK